MTYKIELEHVTKVGTVHKTAWRTVKLFSDDQLTTELVKMMADPHIIHTLPFPVTTRGV